jgi:bifunctional non-homologous end joining protein LigD
MTGIVCALSAMANRVRLIARNGYDWTDRYPWIVEAALKNWQKQFIIDGEAVILGVDGIPDFNALHSRRLDDEVQLYAFDILALDGEDLRPLPLGLRKTNLARLLARRPDGIFVAPMSRARSAPTCSGLPATWGLRVWSPSASIAPIAAGEAPIGSR